MATIGALIYRVQADTKDFQQGMKATRKEVNAARRVIEATRTPTERYNDAVGRLTRLHKLGQLSAEQYRRALDEVNRQYGQGARKGINYAAVLTKVTAALAAAAAAVALVRRGIAALSDTFAQIDEAAKAAEKLGLMTEELIGLRHAANQFSGMESRAFDTAMQRMTRRVAEAAQGTGEAQKAIAELNLDAEKLAAAGPAQAFLEIADAIKGVENPMDRLRLAFKFFDSEGAKLATTLDKGSEAIIAMVREVDELGLSFNAIDAERVKAANDALDNMQKAWQGIKNQVVIAIAPGVEAIAKFVRQILTDSKELDGATGSIGDRIAAIELGWLRIKKAVVDVKVELYEATLAALEFGAKFDRMLGREQTTRDVEKLALALNSLRAEQAGLSGTLAGRTAAIASRAQFPFSPTGAGGSAAAQAAAAQSIAPAVAAQISLALRRLGGSALTGGRLFGGQAQTQKPATAYAANTAVIPGSAEAFRLMEENAKSAENPVNESNDWLEKIEGWLRDMVNQGAVRTAEFVEVSL